MLVSTLAMALSMHLQTALISSVLYVVALAGGLHGRSTHKGKAVDKPEISLLTLAHVTRIN